MDDQVQEALTDAIRESDDKVIEIRPAEKSRGSGLFSMLLLVGGTLAVSYWLRNRSGAGGAGSQGPTEMIREAANVTSERTEEVAEQAADTIEEQGETVAQRVEEGSHKASEEVEQAGERAAEKTEETGEKAADKAEQSDATSSGASGPSADD